ncbi:hypothetical protein BZA77DRAFT_32259 [Pyronema omphalodes]|nr:hypothetical protein BZA77DRAFT_32259 [Pyronema omphalodes]
MAPRTTTPSGSAEPPQSPSPASSLEPLSVRSSIARRRHHVKTRSQRLKSFRAEDNTRRPVQALPPTKPSKKPFWTPVVSLSLDDGIPMEVCVEEDWNGVPEFYMLNGESKMWPEMWPMCMDIDEPEDRDIDKMILGVGQICMEDIVNGFDHMDLDVIPSCEESQISVGVNFSPDAAKIEEQGQNVWDTPPRQVTSTFSFQMQFGIQMSLEEGRMIEKAVQRIMAL